MVSVGLDQGRDVKNDFDREGKVMEAGPLLSAVEEFEVPKGFLFGASEGAIKKPGRLDVAVLFGEEGKSLSLGVVFTKNRFAAAPVQVCRELLAKTGGRVGGLVVNSGCANAVTGDRGLADARTMAGLLEGERSALVCSTGTIGVPLPMDRLVPAVARAKSAAGKSPSHFLNLADAILTTDTRRKVAYKKLRQGTRILGCAKGAGMIAPDMATLLCFVVTDANIDGTLLQELTSSAVSKTLNCLTVDGDTSTNDTCAVFASGAVGPELSAAADDPAVREFAEGLEEVLRHLTIQLAADGEGATTVVEVRVRGAVSEAEARRAAMEVANSPLVKTAVHGRDANWGRIAMALGNSGASFDPAEVSIRVGPLLLLKRGIPQPFDETEALNVLKTPYLMIDCEIGVGQGECVVWTCDFSKDYVEINGAYRT
jgi:glutamate N-acetyltransferase/amino-acid N-acetyltransferase